MISMGVRFLALFVLVVQEVSATTRVEVNSQGQITHGHALLAVASSLQRKSTVSSADSTLTISSTAAEDLVHEFVVKLPHSGSTWFDDLLSSHPKIHHIEEYIHRLKLLEQRVGLVMSNKWRRMSVAAHNLSAVGFSMCPFTEAYSDYGFAVFNHFRNDFSAGLIHQFSVSVPNLRMIFLERTNVVKMALATNAHHGDGVAYQRYPGAAENLPLNASWLGAKAHAIAHGYSNLRELVKPYAEMPSSESIFLHVLYENMQLNVENEMKRVASFLNVDAVHFDVKSSNKSHSESLLDLIPNFLEVKEHFREHMPACYVDMLTSTEARVFEPCD